MSDALTTENSPTDSAADMQSALFAQLVMQQANMAMMLLGKVAHPETGQVVQDLDAARLFIDQLEMLEAKTKGNLTKEESGLLKQSLMTLRLAFVEVVQSPEPAKESKPAQPGAATQPQAPLTATPGETPEEEHRKKFSKKY